MSSEKRIYVMNGVKMPMDTFSKVSEEWQPLYNKAKKLGSMFEAFEEIEYSAIMIDNMDNGKILIDLIVDGMDGEYFAVGQVIDRIDEDDDYVDIEVKEISPMDKVLLKEGIEKLIGVKVKSADIKTRVFTHWV